MDVINQFRITDLASFWPYRLLIFQCILEFIFGAKIIFTSLHSTLLFWKIFASVCCLLFLIFYYLIVYIFLCKFILINSQIGNLNREFTNRGKKQTNIRLLIFSGRNFFRGIFWRNFFPREKFPCVCDGGVKYLRRAGTEDRSLSRAARTNATTLQSSSDIISYRPCQLMTIVVRVHRGESARIPF